MFFIYWYLSGLIGIGLFSYHWVYQLKNDIDVTIWRILIWLFVSIFGGSVFITGIIIVLVNSKYTFKPFLNKTLFTIKRK